MLLAHRYQVDEISPEPSMYEEDFSYVILSKAIPQKAASASAATKPVASSLNADSTTNAESSVS